MRIVCLSDAHNHHARVSIPHGDVIVHAGELSDTGSVQEVTAAMSWFGRLPHRHKIFIAGNHDWLFERDPVLAATLIPTGVHYLCDSGCRIAGISFWGSPVQPEFLNFAFNHQRGPEIDKHWRQIPAGIDVLITHGPPKGKLDLTQDNESAGCECSCAESQRYSPACTCLGIFTRVMGSEFSEKR
jgi:hypothetical protein